MTAIFFALIVFPLIFFLLTGFVFGAFTNGSPAISNQIYLLNCPFPVQNQNAVLGSPPIVGGPNPPSALGGTNVNYTLLAPGQHVFNTTASGANFYCFIQSVAPGGPAVTLVPRDYGATVASFPIGWFQFIGDNIGFIFTKISLTIQLLYVFFTLPADVTGIVWFTLINAVMLVLFGIGIYMLVRGV